MTSTNVPLTEGTKIPLKRTSKCCRKCYWKSVQWMLVYLLQYEAFNKKYFADVTDHPVLKDTYSGSIS